MEVESESTLGTFYEALLSYTLDHVGSGVKHTIHAQLDGIHVESDVIIPDTEEPKFVILSTHSQAESGSHMKFWRNIQEILEIHELYPSTQVVNVIFPSNWKEGLLPLMYAAAGIQITFGEEIKDEVRDAAKKATDSPIDSVQGYKKWLGERQQTYQNIIDALVAKLRYAMSAESDKRWRHYGEYRTSTTTVDFNGDTLFKAGLIKLAFLQSDDRSSLMRNWRDLSNLEESTLERVVGRNVAREKKGIVKRYSLSQQAQYVLENFSENKLNRVFDTVEEYHSGAEDSLLLPLRGTESFDLEKFYGSIQGLSGKSLTDYFGRQMIEWSQKDHGVRNLPLDYLYTVGKEIDWRVSHRTLSEHCGLPMTGGYSPIPKFLYGKGDLSSQDIARIAGFFEDLISRHGLPALEAVRSKLLRETEKKLMKHRYVNYLLYACIDHCKESGFKVHNVEKPMIDIGNGLAKYARSILGLEVPQSAAKTRFSFRASANEDLVFLVISAYDSTHKHKEYPGRWRSARLEWSNEHFRWSDKGYQCIVVLDGLWNQLFSDLDHTLQSFCIPGIKGVYDINTFLNSDPWSLV